MRAHDGQLNNLRHISRTKNYEIYANYVKLEKILEIFLGISETFARINQSLHFTYMYKRSQIRKMKSTLYPQQYEVTGNTSKILEIFEFKT